MNRFYLHYTHSNSLDSYFIEKTVNKSEQAENENGYNLQGLQKLKSKQSITISNNYDIYIICFILLNKHQN